MVIELKYCGLLEDILKNYEKISYEAKFEFFCQVGESANKSISRVLVNLRPLSLL